MYEESYQLVPYSGGATSIQLAHRPGRVFNPRFFSRHNWDLNPGLLYYSQRLKPLPHQARSSIKVSTTKDFEFTVL